MEAQVDSNFEGLENLVKSWAIEDIYQKPWDNFRTWAREVQGKILRVDNYSKF